jgi:predicted Rossmann fold flavoprotein
MPTPTPHFDVIVIGAGAAGLLCAITAGRRGRRVVLLEHNGRVGKKIAISGGGRCNFTNLHATAENYLSAHPDFCRSALARYTPADFTAMVEKHGIGYHEKKLGQQFCDRSSREIIEMLLDESHAAGVKIRCHCRVNEVRKPGRFHLATSTGELTGEALVVATGGLSFATLGATDFGHRLARQFGLRVTDLRPGLVPLAFASEEQSLFQELSGLSLPVQVRHQAASFDEAALFTHRGLSGPAILQISSYWKEDESLSFDLLPTLGGANWPSRGQTGKTSLPALLANHWPRRLAEKWCERYAPQKPFGHYSDRDFTELHRQLRHWAPNFSGTEGYPKAEVTLGGVDTGGLSSKTMEARKVPGLFFIGEVVDVTGWLGGYNFQWAWASGHAAGLAV